MRAREKTERTEKADRSERFARRLRRGHILSVLSVLSVFSALTVSAQQLKVPTETFTLPNGLTLVVHEDHTAPLVAVNVWYHVGSGREAPGRSGFAHLFEHMMFQGSQNVADDEHFKLISEAGGTLNGSTNADRTNYFELVPSNYLELMLYLEADRMGYLLPAMTETKLDNQRDVVKNERRQNYENRPYGMASIRLGEMLYPDDHPYHWPTIGYQADLTAASMEDVQGFFRRWYTSNNASLVVAGDVKPAEVRRLAEKYFGGVAKGEAPAEIVRRPAPISADKRDLLEDRVTLPQLQVAWPTVSSWDADDAAIGMLGQILGQGKSSRLFERLVYREQKAQSVSVMSFGRELAGDFRVTVQAREGVSLTEMERAVLAEVGRLAEEGPTAEEVQRAYNSVEARFVYSLQTLLGKADQLNNYQTFRGKANLFTEDLARYHAVTPADVKRVAAKYLRGQPKVVLSVVPEGKKELAAMGEATP